MRGSIMALQAGTRLGPYEVVSLLGAGGMGEVWLAEDQVLGRKVAIKTLRPDMIGSGARRRLLAEARVVARLDHRNVCGIYEVGEESSLPFIVMPFLEGETLATRLSRGPLKTGEALSVAIQVAEALKAAHSAGILHRDIKPSNVMVAPDGQVRVMDFGIAKLVDQDLPKGAGTESTLTAPGSTIGTTAYMSPEQARGEPLDARSDIFSFGALLFEMLSGYRPFERKSAAETISAILTLPPPLSRLPEGVPAELIQVVSKTLQKDREERYYTAGDLAVDLRNLEPHTAGARRPSAGQDKPHGRRLALRWAIPAGLVLLLVAIAVGFGLKRAGRLQRASPAGEPITSVAVLPLANTSGDAAQEYFADGMTEALITELARIGALKVISRTSIMQYKNARKPLPQIAQELGVEGVVEGSVVRAGNRVRITAQLIHAASDRHLWAESYERDLLDVLSLQRQVARAIAEQVRVRLDPEDERTLLAHRAIAPAVQETYLRGLHLFNTGLTTGDWTGRLELFKRSVTAFEEATRLDPVWAQAWAALARSRHWLASNGNKDLYPAAKAAALKALELDDSVAEAHGALAYILQSHEWAWADAEREYKRAIELNPSIGNSGHHGYGMLLSILGRHEEALAMFAKAEELDPLVLPLKGNAAAAALAARRYEEVLDRSRRLLEIDPKAAWVYALIGWARAGQERPEDALAAFRQAQALSPGPGATASVACGLAITGRRAEAIRLVSSLVSSLSPRVEAAEKLPGEWLAVAGAYACLRDAPRALELLERAFADRLDFLPLLLIGDPSFDTVRSEPRFQALLRKMNLPAQRVG
jgi:TolB-like protein/Flp pilus assembly protein TadD